MHTSAGDAADKVLARFVLVCVAYYVGVIGILHILSPEIDPLHQFMSEYVVGHFGALMTTTFFVLSAASLALAIALIRRRHAILASRFGLLLLVIWALMICVAGTFATDPDAGPRSVASLIGHPDGTCHGHQAEPDQVSWWDEGRRLGERTSRGEVSGDQGQAHSPMVWRSDGPALRRRNHTSMPPMRKTT